ncbi:MAG: hypothetical protein PHY42_06135 [Bacilli bacterium]|nr:hypothetical protein [Bacilli bacterium]
MSLWKQGKQDIKAYYELKLSKKTDYKAFLLAIPLTAIVILPFLLILIQFFKLYYYDFVVRFFLGIVAWMLLMVCNGLSNMFMIMLAKRYYPENPTLMKLSERAVFVYHTFDVFFGVFTLILIIYFGVA